MSEDDPVFDPGLLKKKKKKKKVMVALDDDDVAPAPTDAPADAPAAETGKANASTLSFFFLLFFLLSLFPLSTAFRNTVRPSHRAHLRGKTQRYCMHASSMSKRL